MTGWALDRAIADAESSSWNHPRGTTVRDLLTQRELMRREPVVRLV